MTLQEMLQRRAALAAEMRVYTTDHAADWGTEHDARWAELEAELKAKGK